MNALERIKEIELSQWVTRKCPICFAHEDKIDVQLLIKAFKVMHELANSYSKFKLGSMTGPALLLCEFEEIMDGIKKCALCGNEEKIK